MTMLPPTPSLLHGVLATARLARKRLWRGRSLWVTVFLVALPIVIALLQLALPIAPGMRYQISVETGLRFLCTIAAAIHLAPAIGEEVEGRTYAYLWSRPLPRATLLLGKLVGVLPFLLAASTVSLGVSWLATAQGDPALLPALGRSLLGAAAGCTAGACFAAGVGSLFPRHPLVFAVGYLLAAEQFLPFVPNAAYLSLLFHARAVAGQPPTGAPSESLGGGLVGLLVLGGIWLVGGLLRVTYAEYGRADR